MKWWWCACWRFYIHTRPHTHTGFRTNAAYDRYYEGRKVLTTILENSRALVRDVYSFTLKDHTQTDTHTHSKAPDDDAVLVISADIRRRLDILFVFIRQSVRESLLGFCPDSPMKDIPFTKETFYLDPSEPQLLDLLSTEEATRYADLPARSRPGAVAAEINIILQILGSRFVYVDAFLGKVCMYTHIYIYTHIEFNRHAPQAPHHLPTTGSKRRQGRPPGADSFAFCLEFRLFLAPLA